MPTSFIAPLCSVFLIVVMTTTGFGCGNLFTDTDAAAPSPQIDRLNRNSASPPNHANNSHNSSTPVPGNNNQTSPDAGAARDLGVFECTGPEKETILASSEDGMSPECPSCEDAVAPSFVLEDVQPISCGFGESYGLKAYSGRPTLVTLLSAGCGYCQSQTSKLEEMRVELALEGLDIEMIVINLTSQAEHPEYLADRCSFAVLQDTEDDAVWDLYQGKKDDMYIYDTEGLMKAFFRSGEEPSSNLSTDEGYANVREAIVEVVAP
jgi:hypothetical protein